MDSFPLYTLDFVLLLIAAWNYPAACVSLALIIWKAHIWKVISQIKSVTEHYFFLKLFYTDYILLRIIFPKAGMVNLLQPGVQPDVM